MRRKLTSDLGFLVPAVHIRDNLEFAPTVYRINIAGVPIGEGVIHPDRDLAINPGRVFGKVSGIETTDPAFGMEAVWIEAGARDHAQTLGYTVVDPSTVIATHLSHLIQTHAHELLGHEEVQQLLNGLAKTAPKMIEDLVPKALPMSTVVRVLQDCWPSACRCATCAPSSRRWPSMRRAPRIRRSCRRMCAWRWAARSCRTSPASRMNCRSSRWRTISSSCCRGRSTPPPAGGPGMEPGLAERLQQRLSETTKRQEMLGEPAVLLVPPSLRTTLARFVRAAVPGLQVLAWNEIPDNRRVRLVSAVGR